MRFALLIVVVVRCSRSGWMVAAVPGRSRLLVVVVEVGFVVGDLVVEGRRRSAVEMQC